VSEVGDEMTCRAIRVALLLLAPSAVGCGTAANLVGASPGKKVPFGGVRHDVRCLTQAAGEFDDEARHPSEAKPRRPAALQFLWAADLPLSLVGDVVTWPYTRAYSYVNQPTDYPALLVEPPPWAPATPVPPVTPTPAYGRPQTAP
jgi:uncharacterized protein YceK